MARAHRCRPASFPITPALSALSELTASDAFQLLPGFPMLHFAVVPTIDTAWFDLGPRRFLRKTALTRKLAALQMSALDARPRSRPLYHRDLPPRTCNSPLTAQVRG